ncbi:MAG TPA: TetR/AcrR family transcriptional regulator [Bacteroidales bacterium]|nr:TetR/AcrR family transcriptional regulator [Bacteroidales bacterium]
MKTSDAKYDTILKTGRSLFWKYGFKRVSIEEICREAGISKMTYYKFFPNKIELARKIYDNEADRGIREFKLFMSEEGSPAEKMMRMLKLKQEGTNDISKEFLADFYNNPELGLKEHIEQVNRRLWKEIMDDFRNAQKKGLFRKDIKPELILYFAEKMMDMINDPLLISMYEKPQDMVMELATFFVFGISPKN